MSIELCEKVGLRNRRPVEDLSCVMMGIFHAWRMSFLCDDGRIVTVSVYHGFGRPSGNDNRALVCLVVLLSDDF